MENEVQNFEKLLSILIPVIISLVGTIPALFSYLNSRPSAEQRKKSQVETELAIANKDKIEIDNMSAVMEATNTLLIAPLKIRITELEVDNGTLRDKVEKLECENADLTFQLAKATREMKAAVDELAACRNDIQVRMAQLEKKNGEGK